MTERNPMEVFQQEAPGVSSAFHGLVTALSDTGGLDPKTRQLIYISLKAAESEPMAIPVHTQMAKQAGASRGEVRDAILMTLLVSGLSGVVSCLDIALNAYDSCMG